MTLHKVMIRVKGDSRIWET